MSADSFQYVEGVIVATLVVGYLLLYLVRKLARSREEFRILTPVAVGFGLRLAAIAGISATGLGSTLRGGDEITFLGLAKTLAAQPLGHGDLPHGLYQLQTVLFALELKLGFLSQGAMRIVQVGIALTGVVLILAVVYDFGGPRAARLAAWIFAFEPASLFFDSALHKDPNMELAAGLVVFGGAMIWRRLDVRGILLCALGGAIAVETRSYAGWFLVSAAVVLLLHASLRNVNRRPAAAMPLIYGILVAGFLVTPVLLQLSSKKSLQTLQLSQTANASGSGLGSGPNSDNLKLEQVDFSTRGAILRNLPKRIRDLLLEPYPWQLADSSQRFGAIGTLIAYAIFLLLLRYAWLSRGAVFELTAPLLYPFMFLLVAYALSVGNAGTGFRYRTHLVTLAIAMMAILRENVARKRAARQVAVLEHATGGPPVAVGAPAPV